MAIKSTILKAELQVSDMDRGYYGAHSLTIAQHPSETEERVMLRILAFALHADEALQFTKGISTDDEPDLWQQDLTGELLLWVELGQPEERRCRRAAGRSREVAVYCYGGQSARKWWEDSRAQLEKIASLRVVNVPRESTAALAKLFSRSMQLTCTVQDGEVWFGAGDETVHIALERYC